MQLRQQPVEVGDLRVTLGYIVGAGALFGFEPKLEY